MNTPPPIQDITLLDFFAAAALTGLLANGDRKTAVATAMEMAKKMIQERNQNDSA